MKVLFIHPKDDSFDTKNYWPAPLDLLGKYSTGPAAQEGGYTSISVLPGRSINFIPKSIWI